jgi:5-(carboxyamino)imidazole ribonucleotide synthase
VVGGGQLARMTVQAAIALDIPITILAADPADAAARVWPDVLVGGPDSLEALTRLAERCAVVTFDHELVDPAQLRELEQRNFLLRPGAATMAVARDKLQQRARFGAAGLPVRPFRAAHSADDIGRFAAEHGWPVVVKARRGGYDGRGVMVVPDATGAADAIERYRDSLPVLVEKQVALERELAVLVARSPSGETVVYPVVETVQRDGMCVEVAAPAPISELMAEEATDLGRQIARLVDVVGILAVELFVDDAGRLLVNEIAARPHNSGHLTIDAAATSQFENHLRAILDLPLGAAHLLAPAAVMVNVVAAAEDRTDARLADSLAVAGAHVHLYGKDPRPGRKIGHVTGVGEDRDDVRRRARQAAARLSGEPAILPA